MKVPVRKLLERFATQTQIEVIETSFNMAIACDIIFELTIQILYWNKKKVCGIAQNKNNKTSGMFC